MGLRYTRLYLLFFIPLAARDGLQSEMEVTEATGLRLSSWASAFSASSSSSLRLSSSLRRSSSASDISLSLAGENMAISSYTPEPCCPPLIVSTAPPWDLSLQQIKSAYKGLKVCRQPRRWTAAFHGAHVTLLVKSEMASKRLLI